MFPPQKKKRLDGQNDVFQSVFNLGRPQPVGLKEGENTIKVWDNETLQKTNDPDFFFEDGDRKVLRQDGLVGKESDERLYGPEWRSLFDKYRDVLEQNKTYRFLSDLAGRTSATIEEVIDIDVLETTLSRYETERRYVADKAKFETRKIQDLSAQYREKSKTLAQLEARLGVIPLRISIELRSLRLIPELQKKRQEFVQKFNLMDAVTITSDLWQAVGNIQNFDEFLRGPPEIYPEDLQRLTKKSDDLVQAFISGRSRVGVTKEFIENIQTFFTFSEKGTREEEEEEEGPIGFDEDIEDIIEGTAYADLFKAVPVVSGLTVKKIRETRDVLVIDDDRRDRKAMKLMFYMFATAYGVLQVYYDNEPVTLLLEKLLGEIISVNLSQTSITAQIRKIYNEYRERLSYTDVLRFLNQTKRKTEDDINDVGLKLLEIIRELTRLLRQDIVKDPDISKYFERIGVRIPTIGTDTKVEDIIKFTKDVESALTDLSEGRSSEEGAELRENISQLERELASLNAQIDSYTPDEEEYFERQKKLYQHKSTWALSPLISGMLRVNPKFSAAISSAYHSLTDANPEWKNIDYEKFQFDKIIRTDFVELCSMYVGETTQSHPRSYTRERLPMFTTGTIGLIKRMIRVYEWDPYQKQFYYS